MNGKYTSIGHAPEIITVFSARMYGVRSHKNKKLVDGMRKAVTDATVS